VTDRIPSALTGPASRTKAHEDGEQLEHMLVEICLGVRKEDSRNIHNAADGQTWDELAASVADMKARGIAIEFDDRN
jgi:hypothetical protein